jgi:serine phosphatase RsbU (regulator of sigma subunit)/anti-sigma regulatory factor (Ser/Thr protein kinase)
MASLIRPFQRFVAGPIPAGTAVAPNPEAEAQTTTVEPSAPIDIPESDPLFAYLQAATGPVELAKSDLASPALERLREAGVAIVVPLVTQGELIGTLNLGPRLSEQEYSTDDRRLLTTLAAQAAPAIRVAQLVREQTAEAAERERYDQELRVAQLIQQQFLPRELPSLPEWQVAAYYGPARVVGGDFYDFIDLGEGRIGVAVGDVTDKGVPAALVMARTHSILRAEAPRLVDPSRVLARANELLLPEMPDNMFVTCLFGVLEPATGRFVFANAGHNLPCVRTDDGIVEPRATGLPLGLLPDSEYNETEAWIRPGDEMLLYSDGLVEAHSPDREMYGFGRLRDAVAAETGSGSDVIDDLLERLHAFTGAGWEQEDDITVVTLRRARAAEAWSAPASSEAAIDESAEGLREGVAPDSAPLAAFSLPGVIGGERLAIDRVAEAVAGLGLAPARLERLKTAVGETVMNAIEYGSQGNPDVPVDVRVDATDAAVTVRVTDRALSGPVPEVPPPDLEAKLEGRQRARGWGLFLIRHMVDSVDVSSDDGLQTITLVIARGEDRPGRLP